MPYRSLTPAKYAQQLTAQDHALSTEAPEVDSSDDTTVHTIPLDGGSTHVEHFPDGHAELVVNLGTRVAASLVLSGIEADRIGLALARPHGPTVADHWALSDALSGL